MVSGELQTIQRLGTILLHDDDDITPRHHHRARSSACYNSALLPRAFISSTLRCYA